MIPGTDYFGHLNPTTDVALTNKSSGLAILCKSNSLTIDTTANVYDIGCLMFVVLAGGGLYENTGTSAAPVWTQISTSNAGLEGVFVKNGNGTTLVRLGGSPSSITSGVVTAVEVISLDTNGGQTITFSNGCSTQNVTVKQGSLGAVTGSSGQSMPFTANSGCLTAVSSGSALFVAKAYFASPTNP